MHLLNHDFDYVLILSGDQLYRMDFRTIIAQHIESEADVTIATIPVHRREAHESRASCRSTTTRRITRFVEKPKDPAVQDTLRDSARALRAARHRGREASDLLLASMGIYVFNRDVLIRLLDNTFADFGKHIIPSAIETHRVFSYVFQGYWEDIGTIRAFFEANLDLTSELPRFNFFDMTAPIFTPAALPAGVEDQRRADRSRRHLGRLHHQPGRCAPVDHRHPQHHRRRSAPAPDDRAGQRLLRDRRSPSRRTRGRAAPASASARNTRIENAIIDKNARIGNDVTITPAGKPENVDHPLYYIRDGIVIIPKNGVVPTGP